MRRFGAEDVFAAYEVRASIEGLACRLPRANGVPDAVAAALRACLEEGDRILAGGALADGDLQPYQAMNERFHDAIISLSRNPWVERFVRQTIRSRSCPAG